MSSSKTLRCLFCTFTRTARPRPRLHPTSLSRRPFHATYPLLKAEDDGKNKTGDSSLNKQVPTEDANVDSQNSIEEGDLNKRAGQADTYSETQAPKVDAGVKKQVAKEHSSEDNEASTTKDTGLDKHATADAANVEKPTPSHDSGAEKQSSTEGIDPVKQLPEGDTGNKRPKPKPRSSKKPPSTGYTTEEKEKLRKFYTPAQITAIEAGEAAINSDDVFEQGNFRLDNYRLDYLDDLSVIDPVFDKPIRAPYENHDPRWRLKTDNELEDEIAEYLTDKFDERGDGRDYLKFLANQRMTVGKESVELNPRSFLAPTLPKLHELYDEGMDEMKHEETGDNEEEDILADQMEEGEKDEEDEEPEDLRLRQATGLTATQLKSIRVKNLVTHRVVNQTRLGKIQSMYCLAVAGNQNGLIGIGEGKSAELDSALMQARQKAIRGMQPILRYENRTIFGDVRGKVGAVELKLFNRPAGFGIRTQQYIYEVCRCAGIYDLAARVERSRNPMNTVKATVRALLSQKNPEEIARARGKKLVDVRKVYYAGNAPLPSN